MISLFDKLMMFDTDKGTQSRAVTPLSPFLPSGSRLLLLLLSRHVSYDEVCFFLTRLTVSRFRTFSNVCDDSKIFM